MDLRLTVTSVRFASYLRGRIYRVRITVTVASGAPEVLSDPAREFRPVRNEVHVVSWSRRVHVEDPAATLTLEAVLLDDAGAELERFSHAWPANRFYEHTSLGGRRFTVELMSRVAEGRQVPAGVVYARRHPDGADERPTVVFAPRVLVHAEIDCVVPTPNRPELVRPAFVSAETGTTHVPQGLDAVTGASAVNPAVIPAHAGTPSAAWLSRWTAQVRTSNVWYRGAFAETDLEWTAETLEGDARVEFVGGVTRGYRVDVFGRGHGEVRLNLSHRGRPLSAYRALVRVPRELRARALVCPPRDDDAARRAWGTTDWGRAAELGFGAWGGRTFDQMIEGFRIGLDDVNAFIREANRFLRQLALAVRELTPDDFATESAPYADVVLVPDARLPDIGRRHARAGTVTYVFLHSMTDGGRTSGIALVVPRTGMNLRTTPTTEPDGISSTQEEVDRGTPSASWLHPCGVPPNPASEPTSLHLFVEVRPQGDAAVSALFVGATQLDGTTVAHETGHLLNLAHYEHGARWPSLVHANLMLSGAGINDIDIAQAKIAWQSPLVDASREIDS